MKRLIKRYKRDCTCTTYPCIANSLYKKLIAEMWNKIAIATKKHMGDVVLAFTGTSGAMLAASLIAVSNKNLSFLQIKKDGESTHRSEIERTSIDENPLIIIVDDIIVTGKTLNYIVDKLDSRGYKARGLALASNVTTRYILKACPRLRNTLEFII